MKRALRRARLRADRLLGAGQRTISYRDLVRVQDAWTKSENVRAIARAPRILELLRELYGREPLPFQTLNFKRGSGQSPHSDAWHFNSQPPGFMCRRWTQVTHYFFEGCRYWRPLYSDRDDRHYWEPTWVR